MTHDHPEHGGRCLLGRSTRFPAGLYSTLAGFVEPGESLEETVRRELYEESGIEVAEIQYRSSQPWPFPASLMLGFRARARHDELRIDPDELVDAGGIRAPSCSMPSIARSSCRTPNSIARHLIEEWLYEADSEPAPGSPTSQVPGPRRSGTILDRGIEQIIQTARRGPAKTDQHGLALA